eukprot:9874065-Lingulodinium_polyedra.AAC.1
MPCSRLLSMRACTWYAWPPSFFNSFQIQVAVDLWRKTSPATFSRMMTVGRAFFKKATMWTINWPDSDFTPRPLPAMLKEGHGKPAM